MQEGIASQSISLTKLKNTIHLVNEDVKNHKYFDAKEKLEKLIPSAKNNSFAKNVIFQHLLAVYKSLCNNTKDLQERVIFCVKLVENITALQIDTAPENAIMLASQLTSFLNKQEQEIVIQELINAAKKLHKIGKGHADLSQYEAEISNYSTAEWYLEIVLIIISREQDAQPIKQKLGNIYYHHALSLWEQAKNLYSSSIDTAHHKCEEAINHHIKAENVYNNLNHEHPKVKTALWTITDKKLELLEFQRTLKNKKTQNINKAVDLKETDSTENTLDNSKKIIANTNESDTKINLEKIKNEIHELMKDLNDLPQKAIELLQELIKKANKLPSNGSNDIEFNNIIIDFFSQTIEKYLNTHKEAIDEFTIIEDETNINSIWSTLSNNYFKVAVNEKLSKTADSHIKNADHHCDNQQYNEEATFRAKAEQLYLFVIDNVTNTDFKESTQKKLADNYYYQAATLNDLGKYNEAKKFVFEALSIYSELDHSNTYNDKAKIQDELKETQLLLSEIEQKQQLKELESKKRKDSFTDPVEPIAKHPKNAQVNNPSSDQTQDLYPYSPNNNSSPITTFEPASIADVADNTNEYSLSNLVSEYPSINTNETSVNNTIENPLNTQIPNTNAEQDDSENLFNTIQNLLRNNNNKFNEETLQFNYQAYSNLQHELARQNNLTPQQTNQPQPQSMYVQRPIYPQFPSNQPANTYGNIYNALRSNESQYVQRPVSQQPPANIYTAPASQQPNKFGIPQFIQPIIPSSASYSPAPQQQMQGKKLPVEVIEMDTPLSKVTKRNTK